MSKTKYQRADALRVAKELCDVLAPFCARREDGSPWLVVAGSLRRRKAEVGDIEILYVPQVVRIQQGLFPTDVLPVSRVDVMLEGLLADGLLEKRQNVNGSEMWGDTNKLARHVATGIPVDLFRTTETNWFNYLVCRTGNAASNIAIAKSAQDKGWKWMPYGPGFKDERGDVVPVQSERDAFERVGLAYREPWERNL